MSNLVNIYRHKSSVINDAFDSAVFNLCMNKERHGYKLFYLCGSEPGVGTTSIAVELSISLSVSGWKTLLLDGDLRKDNSCKRLNEEAGVGLADFIKDKATISEIINHTNWENLSYISCGNVEDDNPMKMLYSSNLANLFQDVNDKFDYIIIDGPAISSSVDSNFYSLRADATILVAAMDGSKKKYLEQAYERLVSNQANIIGVIENKVKMSEYRQYVKDYDYFKKYEHAYKNKEKKKTVISQKSSSQDKENRNENNL